MSPGGLWEAPRWTATVTTPGWASRESSMESVRSGGRAIWKERCTDRAGTPPLTWARTPLAGRLRERDGRAEEALLTAEEEGPGPLVHVSPAGTPDFASAKKSRRDRPSAPWSETRIEPGP